MHAALPIPIIAFARGGDKLSLPAVRQRQEEKRQQEESSKVKERKRKREKYAEKVRLWWKTSRFVSSQQISEEVVKVTCAESRYRSFNLHLRAKI